MSRKLPPLYPLRSFEAAARCNSFTVAAEELAVSQSAVSHQVKKLEEYFGVPLFLRRKGTVELTAEGKRLYAACETAFAGLAQISHDLPNSQMRETITLASPPLVFSWWLLPRLKAFQELHPNIRFRFVHGVDRRRAVSGDVDILIHWGKAVPEGFIGDQLMAVKHIAVASPRLAANIPNALNESALKASTLLHEIDYEGWKAWLSCAGMDHIQLAGGWVFDDPGMLIDAALQGAGIALGPFPLIEDLLADGRLVRISDVSAVTSKSYFMAVAGNSQNKPGVRLFRDWLTAYGVQLTGETNINLRRSYLG